MITKPKRVKIITLGCAKNLVDSQELSAQLQANPRVKLAEENPEVLIINTCGFIGDAKQESIDTILEAVRLKEEGKLKNIIVMGCLVSRYAEELKRELPEVDAFYPPWNQSKAVLNFFSAKYRKELLGERVLDNVKHYAYLKISEGCNRKCAFCAIPQIRGRHQSKPIELLVEETEKLVAKGTKEIILIAQDLGYYGIDLYGKPMLGNLLDKLSQIQGLRWIRLHYLYPDALLNDLIDRIAENPKICKYIDLPIQHTSDKILKKMRRGITKKKIYDFVENVRRKIPEIALRTTLITGFPGETQEDFDELLRDIQVLRFDKLGVFTYSHEENTYAFRQYEDTIPQEEKEHRREQIMQLQQQISYEKNLQFVGKTLLVFIDEYLSESGIFLGRTEYDSPEVDNEVLIYKEGDFRVGEFYELKITDAWEYDLLVE